MLNFRSGLTAALLAGVFSSAGAEIVDETTTAKLSFDFSASPVPPPYDNMLFQLQFGSGNDFGNGDAFSIQAFSGSGLAVSDVVRISSPSGYFSGGAIEGTFSGAAPVGSFRSLSEPTGYLQMTGVTGSFDLRGFWVLANNQALWPTPATGWVMYPNGEGIQVASIASPVPEPEAYALWAVGVTLVAALRVFQRRRSGPLKLDPPPLLVARGV